MNPPLQLACGSHATEMNTALCSSAHPTEWVCRRYDGGDIHVISSETRTVPESLPRLKGALLWPTIYKVASRSLWEVTPAVEEIPHWWLTSVV